MKFMMNVTIINHLWVFVNICFLSIKPNFLARQCVHILPVNHLVPGFDLMVVYVQLRDNLRYRYNPIS